MNIFLHLIIKLIYFIYLFFLQITILQNSNRYSTLRALKKPTPILFRDLPSLEDGISSFLSYP